MVVGVVVGVGVVGVVVVVGVGEGVAVEAVVAWATTCRRYVGSLLSRWIRTNILAERLRHEDDLGH